MAALYILHMVFLTHFLNAWSQETGYYKPPIIVEPDGPKILYLHEKDKVVLTCKAEGQPKPKYSWTLNGTLIPPSYQLSVDKISGLLTIAHFANHLEGVYMCVAHTIFLDGTYGTITASNIAPAITLYETRIGLIKTNDERIAVSEYSYAFLRCNKRKTRGINIKYNWYSSARHSSINMDSGRIFIDKHGNIHISYVLKSDDNQTYRCGIIISAKEIQLDSITSIAVSQAPNRATAIKPQLRYSDSEVKVNRFEVAQLECFFSGYDPIGSKFPVTQWYGTDGKKIINDGTKYTISNDSRVLQIKTVLEKDEGFYYCEANNSAGTSPLASIFLNVTSAPILTDGGPKDQTVPENANATFECNARSALFEQPPELPIWYINGGKIDPHTSDTLRTSHHMYIKGLRKIKDTKFKLSSNRTRLTVMNVKKPHDILCVQCEVINHVGTTWGTACLNVIFIRRPAMRQEIYHGDVVDLTVTATTDPSLMLNYRWEFKDRSHMIHDRHPSMIYDPTTHVATINTSSLTSDEYRTVGGVYTLFIYHIYETKIVNIDIVLKDVEQAESSGLHVKLFDGFIIAIFISNIIIIVFIAIICCKWKDKKRLHSLEHKKYYNIARSCCTSNGRTASPIYINSLAYQWETVPPFPDQMSRECQEMSTTNSRLSYILS